MSLGRLSAVSLICLFVASGSCAHADGLEGPDAAAIRANSAAFEAAFNAQSVEGMLTLSTEEYVDWNLTDAVRTREMQRASWEKTFSGTPRTLRVRPTEILVEGAMGVARGEITLTSEDGSTITRRYVEVWRKETDGNWLALWGMDAPAPTNP